MLLNLVKKAKNSLEKLENSLFYRKLRRIQALSEGEKNSSITSSSLYPAFCELAASDSRVYENFRSHPIYTQVLEHVSYEHGVEYLHCCEGAFNEADFRNFARNDATGGESPNRA